MGYWLKLQIYQLLFENIFIIIISLIKLKLCSNSEACGGEINRNDVTKDSIHLQNWALYPMQTTFICLSRVLTVANLIGKSLVITQYSTLKFEQTGFLSPQTLLFQLIPKFVVVRERANGKREESLILQFY